MKTVFPLLLRTGAAALSGILIYASYAPLGWYCAAIIGVALLFLALAPATLIRELSSFALRNKQPLKKTKHKATTKKKTPISTLDLSGRTRFFLGFVHGMVLYLLLLPWIGELVGAFPYVALCVYLSLWSGLLGVCFSIISKKFVRGALVCFPFIYATIEWGRSTIPFGGFAWVRLAWGQVDSPLVYFAPWGGAPLVSFLTTGIAMLFLALCLSQFFRKVLISLIVFGLINVNAWLSGGSADQGHIKVAAVQGNVPQLGLEFNAQRRAVLRNHVVETEKITQPVDAVFWPENAADVNPFSDTQAGLMLGQALDRVQAPILLGTITEDASGLHNTMVVMDPRTGKGDEHNKKFLQPFGEYMPWRSFFRMFTPLVDLAGDFKPGNGTGTVAMHTAQSNQNITVGITTCYEVAFDQAGHSAINAGAQILTTPTNNATFGFSDMTYQQLAMSRMRAIELDRSVIVAATSGVSALIDPDGVVKQKTEIFTSDTLIDDMPLRSSVTFSARYGHFVEPILGCIGIVLLGISIFSQRVRK
ncbi:apolipoprotein N-acyltransferase [Corynebacterium sp. sy039]|uniref:apolipoprotein N-acyltransferase n=1 Tax=Corynebacterium sp. sy039 TaxID=2599641 RepID=UPI0011B60F60|nr:apolipoprotein N-acyltransferase [Corynebacterium sp. sy039]QDZ42590.1 apolipoprotein N-acyltransferase [Corynebacterium sp. sy039]